MSFWLAGVVSVVRVGFSLYFLVNFWSFNLQIVQTTATKSPTDRCICSAYFIILVVCKPAAFEEGMKTPQRNPKNAFFFYQLVNVNVYDGTKYVCLNERMSHICTLSVLYLFVCQCCCNICCGISVVCFIFIVSCLESRVVLDDGSKTTKGWYFLFFCNIFVLRCCRIWWLAYLLVWRQNQLKYTFILVVFVFFFFDFVGSFFVFVLGKSTIIIYFNLFKFGSL